MPSETDSPHAHNADQLPAPTVEEVSPGIYAYIQLDGSWGLNNTGFITGSNAVSVIDTCFTEARTRAFLRAIGGVTDLPIRTLGQHPPPWRPHPRQLPSPRCFYRRT